jgi:hypothetical protein
LRLRAAGLARSFDTRSSRHTFRHRALAQPLVEELPSIVALLAGEDATARLHGITNVCKCTRAEGWVPARVVWEALLPHVLPLAWPGAGAEAVQFEALWTLTNLTSADGWSGPLVVLGVADAALATLQQEVAGLDVREQAVWLLGNLLGERVSARTCGCACMCVLLSLRGSVYGHSRFAAWVMDALRRRRAAAAAQTVGNSGFGDGTDGAGDARGNRADGRWHRCARTGLTGPHPQRHVGRVQRVPSSNA